MCGRSDDLREWFRLIAGFSGGGISDDSIGTSTIVDGGGVVSMAAVGELATAGIFAGNEGVIMVQVVGVVMKGGAETGADGDAGTMTRPMILMAMMTLVLQTKMVLKPER